LGSRAFYFDGSTWTTLLPPGAISAGVGGISGGTAAGTATYSSGVAGYIYNPATGYSLPLNVVDFFNFPGFFPSGFRFDDISGNKVIGTVFYNSVGSGLSYGFIATIPEPSTLMLAGLGLAPVLFAACRRRRIRGSPRSSGSWGAVAEPISSVPGGDGESRPTRR
jgi:hypothetical protein